MDYKDAVFGYTEMSNVGLLSAAAVKMNWFSVCEYQSLKQSKSDGRENSNGRVDLYYCDNKNNEWLVEAKQIARRGCNITDNKAVNDKYDEVTADIKRTVNNRNKNEREQGCAILFIPQYIETGCKKSAINNSAKNFKVNLRLFARTKEAYAWSYYRPKKRIKEWTHTEDLVGLGSIIMRV